VRCMQRGVLRVDTVPPQSEALARVRHLWGRNRATLGFFPDGAFEEYATKGLVLGAFLGGELVGYALYRISGSEAAIAHLCVDEACRRQGVAGALLDAIKTRTKHLLGIRLWCRRDYEANKLWPRFNFISLDDRPSKAKDGGHLTLWKYEHRQLPLLQLVENRRAENRLRAVIDSSVFFDFGSNKEQAIESKALLADWIQDRVLLCVTGELFNEIARREIGRERRRNWQLAKGFVCLMASDEAAKSTLTELSGVLPEVRKVSDESDLRHLAHAISRDAKFFLTRDEKILNHQEVLYNRYALVVLRPSDFISRMDLVEREEVYQPCRLAGTQIRWSRLVPSRAPEIITLFQDYARREPKANFEAALRSQVSSPRENETSIIEDSDGKLLALISIDLTDKSILFVPILRLTSSPLASTIGFRVISNLISRSIAEKKAVIVCKDRYVTRAFEPALEELGFVLLDSCWQKISLTGIRTVHEIDQECDKLSTNLGAHREYIEEIRRLVFESAENAATSFLTERHLWPLKVKGVEIPSYILPIRPYWAAQLFDEELAKADLFGARAELMFLLENVYYRSARPQVLQEGPGRILWYVSGRGKAVGTKSIRACSRLEGVMIGPAKELFRDLRRLGVYQWRDVIKTSKGNPLGPIMAIRFSHTESFKYPISLETVREILADKAGIRPTFQSPIRIPSDCFRQLYERGNHGSELQEKEMG
jgi:ribosomal protein S18 acetylase RimI-like enzyme/predicted nucleic acid-binding protein